MTFIKYLLVGIANTLVGLGTIYFAMYFLRLEIIQANVLGYSVGILLSFVLNKTWTFSSNDHIVSSFLRFTLVLALAYTVNLVTVLVSNSYFGINPYLAQALGMVPYTVIGFIGSRLYAFRTQGGMEATIDPAHEATLSRKKPLNSPMIDVSIVVPCYNEAAVLPETTSLLANLLHELIGEGMISPNSRVYYVDDGSRDRTWEVIEAQAVRYEFVRGIKLSRNHGHQNALLAGLLTAEGEVVISLDADLQDDLSAIRKMIELFAAGNDIVYGVRDTRKADTIFKRFSAQAYYHLLRAMRVEIVYNHADYRLMSRQVIEVLREFGEVNVFLRGIIPQLGFSHALVYYDRAERYAGESKYPLKKMLALAWQGITSFSDLPLRLITIIGLLVSMISFLVAVWAISVRLFTQDAIPGWTSTILPVAFLGGIQLLCLGIMSEYLGKIYSETKRRPRYIIEKTI
jgi:glycosyltransferase involved in cell wall biosynthesis/putative flippase GtrA